jgi:hypothetical protein
VSAANFCNNGREVIFTPNAVHVRKNGKIILTDSCRGKLWVVPITQKARDYHATQTGAVASNVFSFSAYKTTNKQELIQFLHAAAGSPVPATWLQAIRNQHYATWPGLTEKAANKYLPKSMATAKGHLDKGRQNTGSTKPRKPKVLPADTTPPAIDSPDPNDITNDMFPIQETEKTHSIFISLVSTKVHNGKVYTDLAGAYPNTAYSGMKYMLVLYDYDSNAILVKPLRLSRLHSTIPLLE